METANDWVSLIYTLVGSHAIFFGLIAYLQKKDTKSIPWFSLFLWIFGLPSISWLLHATPVFYSLPRFAYWPIGLYFCVMPTFYLYVKSLTQIITFKEVRKHLFFPILEFCSMLTICLLPRDIYDKFISSGANQTWGLAFVSVLGAYNLFYCFITFRLSNISIRKFEKVFINDSVNLFQWTKRLSILLGILYGLELFLSFPITLRINYSIAVVIAAILNLVFVLTVLFASYKYLFSTNNQWNQLAELEESSPEYYESDTVKESILDSNPAFVINEKLVKQLEYLLENGAYLNQEVSLISLAQELDVTPKVLSKTISEAKGLNFSGLINEYRVNRAKVLLSGNEHEYLTIEGIGSEAGFPSKSTFFSVFKKHTGLTPKEFQLSKTNDLVQKKG